MDFFFEISHKRRREKRFDRENFLLGLMSSSFLDLLLVDLVGVTEAVDMDNRLAKRPK